MKKKDKDIDAEGNSVSKPKKKTSTKKKRVPARIKKMALRYEAAWKTVFGATDSWKRAIIEEEPSGRHARELYHEAAKLAESEGFEPKKAIYAGKGKTASNDDIFPEMISGKQFPDDDENSLF